MDVADKASQEMLVARRESTPAMSASDRLQLEAVDLTITREFTAAVAKYEQVPKTDTSGLFVDLGRAYEKAGLPQKAIDSFRRAAEGVFHDPAAWLWLGVLHGRASDRPLSENAFQRAEEEYRLTSNLEGLTEVEYQRGVFSNNRGALAEAADHLRKALETARLSGNIHQELSSELRLGTNAYLAGDAEAAERDAQHALETAQANQMEPLAIRGLITLGGAFFRKQDYAGAEKYYQQALALARRNSARHLTALALLSLAADHDQLNRSADTLREAQEALDFYQMNRYTRESLQCFTLLGRAEASRGNYSAALDWYQRSLTAAEKAGDRAQIALAHESLGAIYFTEEQFPKALEQYSLSLRGSTDDEHVGYAALQSADVLWRLGRYDEALQALDQAGAKALNFPRLQARIQRAHAEMTLSQRHYAKAASEAEHAIESQRGEDRVNAADLWRILGSARFLAGRKREGFENCQKALKTAADLGEPSLLLRARIDLAFVYAGSGNHSAAASLIRAAETALQATPESRFRAFALMASWDSNYREPALRALNQLEHDWGDGVFHRYRKRPGIQELWLSLEEADHNSR